MKDLNRFMSFVDVQSGPDPCWFWTGHNSGKGRGGGYGRFSFKGCTVAAHRWIYRVKKGRLRKNYHIDHKRCNRCCVNPDHLEQVTPSTN